MRLIKFSALSLLGSIAILLVLSSLSTAQATTQIPLQGPSSNIDSLLTALSNYEVEDEGYIDLLNQLGYEYWTVSPRRAQEFGQTALDLAKAKNYAEGAAFSHRVIGVAYWVMGNYSEGLDQLLRGLHAYEALQDTLGVANCTMNIGLIYSDQRNYDRALAYFEEALMAFRRLNETDRVATTLTKMGTVYTEQKEYQKALEGFTQALKLHENAQFYYGIAEVNNRISLLFFAQEEYVLAKEYAEQSIALSKRIGDKEGEANNLQVLGEIHLKRQEYDRAEATFTQGLAVANALQALKFQRDFYRGLRDVSQAKGNFAAAYTYFEKYESLKDSVFNEEVSSQIANLQTQQELMAQQKELEIANVERDLNATSARYSRTLQIALALGLLLVITLSGAIIFALRNRLKRNQQILAKNQELTKTREHLQKVDLENAQLKASDLQRELDYKNRELTAYTLNFAQKNQLIDELKEQLGKLKPTDANQQKQVKQLRSLVSNTRNVDRDWEDFRLHFESVHPHFFQRLKQVHPEMSNGEQKLCSLIRLNLSMKETAAILGISPNSVKTARYRLRSKLGLETQDNLLDYLMDFEKELVSA